VPPERRLRRGIYLLPTLFTVGNLFCGFASQIQTSHGRWAEAALLIMVAGLLDGLDGRIARLTGSTSEFGVEFDSLADLVSFGMAPAFLAYHWALVPLERRGWVVAFLFVACAATRLARFNIQKGSVDRRFFVGLASPAAAGVIATTAFAFPDRAEDPLVAVPAAAVVVALALLMVSTIRYRSFKEIDLARRRPYRAVLVFAAVLVGLFQEPGYTLLAMAGVYAASGPAAYALGVLRRGRERVAAGEGLR